MEVRPLSAADTSTTASNPKLLTEVDRKFLEESEDYPAIGNLVLEVLTRPHQETSPDNDAKMLASCLPRIIARRYKIPETLNYTLPYRDEHIAYEDRGTWARDEYVQLIILAYVLGASRRNLRPPHNAVVCYYLMTASRQRSTIEATAENYLREEGERKERSAIRERVLLAYEEHAPVIGHRFPAQLLQSQIETLLGDHRPLEMVLEAGRELCHRIRDLSMTLGKQREGGSPNRTEQRVKNYYRRSQIKDNIVEIELEIHRLKNSGEHPHLIDEEVAQLNRHKEELLQQLLELLPGTSDLA